MPKATNEESSTHKTQAVRILWPYQVWIARMLMSRRPDRGSRTNPGSLGSQHPAPSEPHLLSWGPIIEHRIQEPHTTIHRGETAAALTPLPLRQKHTIFVKHQVIHFFFFTYETRQPLSHLFILTQESSGISGIGWTEDTQSGYQHRQTYGWSYCWYHRLAMPTET